MIFTRKIESELLRWKNAANRRPIVLRGARQVGKTFVVNRFAENFDHFIDIKLERPKERDLFSDFNTGQELVERILLYKGQKIDTKSALLFIDEIQHSAEAVQSLRYLYEDVEKYSNLATAKYLTHAIDRAPLYAGERITYEKFGESSFRSREMKEAFDVLERALIVYRSRPSVSTHIPIIEKLRKAPKLFFLDVGLVNYRIGFKEFFSKQSLDNVYQGNNTTSIPFRIICYQDLMTLSNGLCPCVRPEAGFAGVIDKKQARAHGRTLSRHGRPIPQRREIERIAKVRAKVPGLGIGSEESLRRVLTFPTKSLIFEVKSFLILAHVYTGKTIDNPKHYSRKQ